jgi:hypothetical protein
MVHHEHEEHEGETMTAKKFKSGMHCFSTVGLLRYVFLNAVTLGLVPVVVEKYTILLLYKRLHIFICRNLVGSVL